MTEPGSFELVEGNRAYSFYFSSWRAIPKIQLKFGATQGEYDVEIAYFDEGIFKERISQGITTIDCPSTPYLLGKKHLYHIYLILNNSPDISTAANPFHFAIIPTR
jgi:hypothetical protein